LEVKEELVPKKQPIKEEKVLEQERPAVQTNPKPYSNSKETLPLVNRTTPHKSTPKKIPTPNQENVKKVVSGFPLPSIP